MRDNCRENSSLGNLSGLGAAPFGCKILDLAKETPNDGLIRIHAPFRGVAWVLTSTGGLADILTRRPYDTTNGLKPRKAMVWLYPQDWPGFEG
jgi:hypothetical protein